MLKQRVVVALAAFLLSLCVAAEAEAFCGFYVSGASTELYNDATMVSLMRDGQTTVMTMRNNYRGPAEDFAMVVPVPEVLDKKQVKTLPDGIFERLRKQTAPRLVEYEQQDPCEESPGIGDLGQVRSQQTGTLEGAKGGGAGQVAVEAEFDVGEYQIVVLSADESHALDNWLRNHDYAIPEGAAEHFRPYIQQGSYFFVAKVDIDKVDFEEGRAMLSPLRFHYEAETFKLPIRLGLVNSSGEQDLLVHVLAEDQRYDVANRESVTIPTNIPVEESARGQFDQFYESLFSRVMEANPGTVVTEYAWQASGCDPCPPNQISDEDFMSLGGDVVTGSFEQDSDGDTSGGNYPSKELEGIEVDGAGLDSSAVRNVLTRYQARTRKCYERQLKKVPSAGGKVVVVFAIGGEGRVVESAALDDTIGWGVGQCLANVIDDLRFPTPNTSEGVSVAKTFVFHPSDVDIQPGIVGNPMRNWVVTRLHTRYSDDRVGDDLVFEKAPPITGGRGSPQGRRGSFSSHGAEESSRNQFQARYAMLDRWTGEVACDEPNWDRWGGGSMEDSPDQETRIAGDDEDITLASAVDWQGTEPGNRNAMADRVPGLTRPDEIDALPSVTNTSPDTGDAGHVTEDSQETERDTGVSKDTGSPDVEEAKQEEAEQKEKQSREPEPGSQTGPLWLLLLAVVISMPGALWLVRR